MIRSYKTLVGKLERERPVGRPKPKWEDNIRMNLRETGCEFAAWFISIRTGRNDGL
jgi:hypothetical protein